MPPVASAPTWCTPAPTAASPLGASKLFLWGSLAPQAGEVQALVLDTAVLDYQAATNCDLTTVGDVFAQACCPRCRLQPQSPFGQRQGSALRAGLTSSACCRCLLHAGGPGVSVPGGGG